jgi:adenylate cyclase
MNAGCAHVVVVTRDAAWGRCSYSRRPWIGARKSCLERPNVAPLLRGAAAANALARRQPEAERAVALLRVLDPAPSVRDVRTRNGPFGRPEDLARFEEGLRKAGLPE